MPPLKITLAQINFTIGDIENNIVRMAAAANEALAKQADMIVFSELCVTGYYPADLLNEPDFQHKIEAGIQKILNLTLLTKNLYWVIGTPIRPSQFQKKQPHIKQPQKKQHNGLLVIVNGTIVLSYAKQLLPDYDIFNEHRHFEPGLETGKILTIKNHRLGFLICEDSWNDDEQSYAINPLKQLAEKKPALIISINASPSNLGKREQRHTLFSAASTRYQVPIIFVNQIGGHDQIVFDGASFIVTPEKGVVVEAKSFEEDLLTVQFDQDAPLLFSMFSTNDKKQEKRPELNMSTMEFYRRQIVLGLRDYVRRCGFQRVIVGSSGGIDSALTLALATEALGADNVAGITMPSCFSSLGSVSDSANLCRNLGIKLYEHPINALVDQYQQSFTEAFEKPLQGIALENLQARIRGTILMAYSNSFGHLLLTTGNKSELSVGYCTLYGDTNGGLGLIGDLYKTEIFALSLYLNQQNGRELIPISIIEKPPSAELAPDQKDSDSLPPYPILDALLKILIEGDCLLVNEKSDEKTEALKVFDALSLTSEGQALIVKIKTLIARNEYKRRQTPPILKLRARAFGLGRQMPISAKYTF